MDEEKMKSIILNEKETRLNISRVPRKTRAEFVAFANEEFEEDYGMALKFIWDNFKLFKMFFENVDYKLDKIIDNTTDAQILEQEEEVQSKRTLSGRELKGGKK